ncbi:MAG: sensor histidine kinase [Chloroflexota bacterium]
MAVLADLRAVAHRHPDLAELGLGVAVGALVLVVSLTQAGLTDAGVAKGLIFGIPLAVFSSWRYRRRRQDEELRERRRLEQRVDLARELHDAVAGHVAVVGIQAAAARRILSTDPEAAASALEQIEIASRAAVADLRRMLVALREGGPADIAVSAAVAPGLGEVGRLVAEARAGGVDVAVRHLPAAGIRPAVPRAVDHAAYRIVQEGLTNAVRHGASGRATVDIEQADGELRLRIRNAVRDASAPAGTPGLGLRGMRERAALFDGELTAGPAGEGEWLVDARLRWPMEAAS